MMWPNAEEEEEEEEDSEKRERATFSMPFFPCLSPKLGQSPISAAQTQKKSVNTRTFMYTLCACGVFIQRVMRVWVELC